MSIPVTIYGRHAEEYGNRQIFADEEGNEDFRALVPLADIRCIWTGHGRATWESEGNYRSFPTLKEARSEFSRLSHISPQWILAGLTEDGEVIVFATNRGETTQVGGVHRMGGTGGSTNEDAPA